MNSTATLLDWFRVRARDLPWRQEPRDSYRTLVSEFMLQQTQVDRVVPRFLAFVDRFPDLGSLAEADEAEVLALWSGLGYYARARRLHRLARVVCGDLGGVLPRDAKSLRELPGVGEYTAAAVASLAFGAPEAVLDGNTRRVGLRFLALDVDSRPTQLNTQIVGWIGSLFEGHHPGEVNEALMELGATVCLPTAPQCKECPLSAGCAGRATGSPEDFAITRSRRKAEDLHWVAACVVSRDGWWLVREVVDGPILQGLLLPPFTDLLKGRDRVESAKAIVPASGLERHLMGEEIRHSITYRRIRVVPVFFPVARAFPVAAPWRWTAPGRQEIATSSLFSKLQAAYTAGT